MSKKLKALKANTYSNKELGMYLTGMVGQNMIYNIITTGLAYYLQSVIFIPTLAISVLFLVARIWDAINDPMMGTIVDKTHSKYGKCRPYLIYAPAAIGIITILTFTNGIYTSATSKGKIFIVAWACFSYLLWGMSFTVGDIPLWGITALMTSDENDRSKILAFARIAATAGGGVVLAAIIPVSQAVGGNESLISKLGGSKEKGLQMGFIIVTVILTIIGTILFEMAGIGTKERIPQTEKRHTMKENFSIMWSNKPFRQILISSVLRAPIQLLNIVAMTLLSYYFGNNGNTNYIIYMVILGGGIMGGQLIIQYIMPLIIAKNEKSKVYNICSLGSAFPLLLIYVIYKIAPQSLDKPFWLAIEFIVFTLAGVAMGAVNVLQSVMIADAVDYEEYHNKIRPDGVFFSGQSFATKLTSGISAALQGVVFAIVGFSGAGVKAVNDALANGASFKADFPQYAEAMFFLCSILPAIGMALSVIPTWKYALSDKEHAKILEELNVRHEEMKKEESTKNV